MIQHKINTGNAAPVKQNPRRLPVAMQEEADRELSRMLDAGVIEPSMSPWAAPIVLVRKKDGSVRYCIDFRKINSLTKRDSYTLPRTQDCLEALHGSWYSTIDLQSGYWQVPVDPVDREKTAFVTKQGLFQLFQQMVGGISNTKPRIRNDNYNFCRFGVPRQVHIDKGRQFESKLFTGICKRFNIDKTRTSPLHPPSEGMVERLNRTIGKDEKDWDTH
ncbi:unnamed protein product [Mytilus edulis]|uniref:Integrase catalytic domain-containing protein n=1 Tax=Mytilus edulis TaxID=6550 RepID=A0A8S3T2Y2_MYTED|nr:unnamed protein product [Mytilus edulis]